MKLKIAVSAIIPLIFLTSCFQRSKAVVIPNIEQAPEFVSERRLAFRGIAHLQLSGSYNWNGPTTGQGKLKQAKPKDWKYVIPVTGPDWDRSRPVPLWVTFSLSGKNQQSQMSAFQRAIKAGEVAGINVDFPTRTKGMLRGKSPWQHAVNNAEERHGVTTDPRAPIVSWRP
ncbi:MAG: hypothetical protein P1U58_13400 [Verrucomicrobiales bacterium]|nr:hypothetical protein [Verrucomicrobiales bacterium]